VSAKALKLYVLKNSLFFFFFFRDTRTLIALSFVFQFQPGKEVVTLFYCFVDLRRLKKKYVAALK